MAPPTAPYKLTTDHSNSETPTSLIIIARIEGTEAPSTILTIKMTWIIATVFLLT